MAAASAGDLRALSGGLAGGAFGSTQETHTVTHAIGAVQLSGGNSDVTVVGGAPAGTVEVTRRADWRPGASLPPSPETWQQDTLVLDAEMGCVGLFTCSVDYTLRVPDGTAVTIDSGSGDVEVEGGLGAVVLKAESGDVDSRILSSQRVQVVTNSGDVDLSLSSAPTELTIQANSGDVDVTVPPEPRASYDVVVETDSGDENSNLVSSDDSPRKVQVRTGSGDVELGYR